MAKDDINNDGENNRGREDEVKSYRGVVWALISVGAFVVIVAILLFSGILKSVTDDKRMESPREIEQKRN